MKPLRILVADDIPTNILILNDLLQEAGHEVVTVRDGTEILECLTPTLEWGSQTKPFDIVFTDVSMPTMNGDEAARRVRELEASRGIKVHVPIVAITAHIFAEEQNAIRSAGVDDLITKPIRVPDLARCLTLAAQRREQISMLLVS